MSQGDAGARNWAAYRDEVVDASATRVRMALNLSAAGESGPNRCFEHVADIDVATCAEVAAADEVIWGIAVVTLQGPCGDLDPRMIMARARAAGERAGKPLLVGTRMHGDWSLDEQLEELRPGDVVTYCFNALPENMLVDGKVRDSVWRARERGVLFDIGHGMQSFAWPVAEAALAEGFYPDTVSTDQYIRHVGSQPQHDLPRTISKLIVAGLPEREALARATARPAEVLKLAGEVGTLAAGACADLAILRFNEGALPLCDVRGDERPGGCWEPLATVRAGVIRADHR
jgi:dihydroorotase